MYSAVVAMFLTGEEWIVFCDGGESVGSFRLATRVMSVILRRGFHILPGLRHENPLVSDLEMVSRQHKLRELSAPHRVYPARVQNHRRCLDVADFHRNVPSQT